MCGITGFAERNHKAETARRIVKGMADLITYRGPDGEGYYVDDQVALGHRRLSIIDLEGGKQPMFNEDGSLVCIFNGEIYNFQTLREELIAAGHTFATRSDTEVLLHGYEQWGNQLPGKLRGMFTFVIWDQKTKTMFGARDIFGIKPFYYYNQDGLFLFGSEIKSFLAHPGFKKELNEERLPEYLSIEYIPNEETMFKNVYKLPSGCMFTWENGELTVERYYEIKYHVDDSKSLEEWEKSSPIPLPKALPPTRLPMLRLAASFLPVWIPALWSTRLLRVLRMSRASRSVMRRKNTPSCRMPRSSVRKSVCPALPIRWMPNSSLKPTA